MADPVRVWDDLSVPRCLGDVAAQRAQASTVLLHLGTGQYYALDGAGGSLFELFDGRRTLGEIVAAVARAYAVDEQRVRADAVALLDRLAAEGLIEDAR